WVDPAVTSIDRHRHGAIGIQSDVPQGSRGIWIVGIVGVDAIVHGRHEDDIVYPFTGNQQMWYYQRLRVDQAIQCAGEQLAEPTHVDVAGSEDRLLGIDPRAHGVVVLRGDRYKGI